ncbi:hypothetical protein CRE_24626 [Caenorhabditis remanei]|uniref:Uncharacterized protein n=1 Tax=Caenorhabditis remanei TaxID=31234 RepID=E3MVH5_CAERE|nr:hypothetical protein CRE_24626 [Caenorhabditis remanei]
MGAISFILYSLYLLFFPIFLFIIASNHLDLFNPQEKSWGTALYFIWIISNITFIDFHKDTRQTPESFIRIRCLSIISVLLLCFCFIFNSLKTLIMVPVYIAVIVRISIFILLIYQSIPFWLHLGLSYGDFKLFHVKTARLSKTQWLLLFLFHTLLSVGCYGLFCIDANILETDGLIDNFHFIRYACIAINILSIPMTYQSLLAWNSEKLEFVGIHPQTKLYWKGVMRKMEDGNWEVDQTPEDHDLFLSGNDCDCDNDWDL